MPDNYRLHCSLSPYEPGGVVPAHALVGHDTDRLCAMGLIEPTDAPVSVAVAPPPAGPRPVPPTVYDERNSLSAECEALSRDNQRLSGTVKELEKKNKALTEKCGRLVENEAHLTAACEEHQAAVARLEGGRKAPPVVATVGKHADAGATPPQPASGPTTEGKHSGDPLDAAKDAHRPPAAPPDVKPAGPPAAPPAAPKK